MDQSSTGKRRPSLPCPGVLQARTRDVGRSRPKYAPLLASSGGQECDIENDQIRKVENADLCDGGGVKLMPMADGCPPTAR